MNRTVSWVALTVGVALVGAAVGVGIVTAAGWVAPNPVTLIGAGGVGAVAAIVGLVGAVHAHDVNTRIDGYTNVEADLGDVLRLTHVRCCGPVGTGVGDIADAVGVTRGGAR